MSGREGPRPELSGSRLTLRGIDAPTPRGFELVGSLFAVAGNAFLSSTSSYARECVGVAFQELPHAGHDPELHSEIEGTKPGEPQSDKEVPEKSDETPPAKKDILDP